MSPRRSFVRKIIYFAAIALLLLPLSQLSRPASGDKTKRKQGGVLSEMRKTHQLSQSNLGEIDPASETMKLATLGMRGVAANILWGQANHYKKVEDWTKLSAALEQITKLQPNFISVWQYQAWNLSYNVSVEFDDYRDRYYWVIRGINFLKDGERHNQDHPKLLWDIGWFLGNKIGRADERIQYRRLFKKDDDFHGDRVRGDQRDNWLVSREWFLRAEDAVLHKGKSLGAKNPATFYSDQAMSLINYAEALEQDGVHGEKAKLAWKRAAEQWQRFGQTSLVTSYGRRIHLNDLERKQEEVRKNLLALDSLTSGIREKLEQQRRSQLTSDQRAALDTPAEKRTPAQQQLAIEAEQLVTISPEDLAAEFQDSDSEKMSEAKRLARLLADAEEEINLIEIYRNVVNFAYWRTRCAFEQTPAALEARELLYKGDQALAAADLQEAQNFYDRGFAQWRKVFDAYPEIVTEGPTGQDLIDTIVKYRRILSELDEEFPQDFILRDVVEKNDSMGELTGLFHSKQEPAPTQQQQTTEESSESKPGQEPKQDESTPEQPPQATEEPSELKTDQEPEQEKPAPEQEVTEKSSESKSRQEPKQDESTPEQPPQATENSPESNPEQEPERGSSQEPAEDSAAPSPPKNEG